MQARSKKPGTRSKAAKKVKRDDPDQSRQFIKKAKEIEADQESDDAADSIMERLGSTPPKELKDEKPGR